LLRQSAQRMQATKKDTIYASTNMHIQRLGVRKLDGD